MWVGRLIPQCMLCNEKQFNPKSINDSTASPPLSLVYAMDDQEDQLHIFKELTTNNLNEHAPQGRIMITGPSALFRTVVNRAEH